MEAPSEHRRIRFSVYRLKHKLVWEWIVDFDNEQDAERYAIEMAWAYGRSAILRRETFI